MTMTQSYIEAALAVGSDLAAMAGQRPRLFGGDAIEKYRFGLIMRAEEAVYEQALAGAFSELAVTSHRGHGLVHALLPRMGSGDQHADILAAAHGICASGQGRDMLEELLRLWSVLIPS